MPFSEADTRAQLIDPALSARGWKEDNIEPKVLEMGEAEQAEDGEIWGNYTTHTRVEIDSFPSVAAIAQDLPGNREVLVIS